MWATPWSQSVLRHVSKAGEDHVERISFHGDRGVPHPRDQQHCEQLSINRTYAASGLLWVGALGPGPPAACAGLATCVALMLATRSAHPPGGALVLILSQSPGARLLGPLWLLYPGLAGALLLWGCWGPYRSPYK